MIASGPHAKASSPKLRRYKPSRAGKKRTKKDGGHVSRPMNAFMVWQVEMRPLVQQRCPHLQNHMVSIELGRLWKTRVSEKQKAAFSRKATRYAQIHKQQHPDYKYRPKNKMRAAASEVSREAELANNPTFNQALCHGETNVMTIPSTGPTLPAYTATFPVDPLADLRSLFSERSSSAVKTAAAEPGLPCVPVGDELFSAADLSAILDATVDVSPPDLGLDIPTTESQLSTRKLMEILDPATVNLADPYLTANPLFDTFSWSELPHVDQGPTMWQQFSVAC